MKNTVLKWLYAIPGRNKFLILALIAAQGLYGGAGVLYAFLLRGVVDSAAAGSYSGFVRYLVSAILLIVMQLGMRALVRWLTELAKSNIENIFKVRLTDTILHRDYLKVSSVHSGEWLNRLTNDTVVIANGYVEIIPGISGMAVKLFGALGMIVALEPYFAAILIPSGCATLLFQTSAQEYAGSGRKASDFSAGAIDRVDDDPLLCGRGTDACSDREKTDRSQVGQNEKVSLFHRM